MYLQKVHIHHTITDSMFSFAPNIKIVISNTYNQHLCWNCQCMDFKKKLGTFGIGSHLSNWTKANRTYWHRWHLNCIQMWTFKIPSSGLNDSHINRWHGSRHTTALKRLVSVLTDNVPKHIDPRKLHHKWVLFGVRDNVVELQWNTDVQMELLGFCWWLHLHLHRITCQIISQYTFFTNSVNDLDKDIIFTRLSFWNRKQIFLQMH